MNSSVSPSENDASESCTPLSLSSDQTAPKSLFSANRPSSFWQLIDPHADEIVWTGSTLASYQAVFGDAAACVDDALEATLGEGRFGPDHWRLSRAKRVYYELKPYLPRALTRVMRKAYGRWQGRQTSNWPIDERFVNFLMLTLRGVFDVLGVSEGVFHNLWPDGKGFAFVLTHDIETAVGQSHAIDLANIEEHHGFRSSFNFVPERYRVDQGLIRELRVRGFEIGIHDLHHDGKLFGSSRQFATAAGRINRHASELGAVGFRAALMHRNPEWMQALDFMYDLSFFDTDPYEPIPGGSTTIWPFYMGRLTELPCTLVQDYTLTTVLGQTTPSIWTQKVEYIANHHGMALLNSHPDYLVSPSTRFVYERFLAEIANREDPPWHALPMDVAQWWRGRTSAGETRRLSHATAATIGTGGWDTIRPATGTESTWAS